jgi:hypothetical protein
VTNHVDSVLMLSGIDPNIDIRGSIDGSTIYRTVNMSHSLLLHPDGYNAMLGRGKPRHSSDGSFMIAFRETARRKELTWGANDLSPPTVFTASPVEGDQGVDPITVTTFGEIRAGTEGNPQSYSHVEMTSGKINLFGTPTDKQSKTRAAIPMLLLL